jgi:hypothetical protein
MWDNTGTLSVGDSTGIGTFGRLSLRNGGQVKSSGDITVLGRGVLSGDGQILANVVVGDAVNFNANSRFAVVAPGYIDESTNANVLGELHIEGDYRQVSGTLKIELGAGANDRLDVVGDVTILNAFFGPSTLEISLVGGSEPGPGQTFDILDWTGTLSGAYQTVVLPTLSNGNSWDISQLYTQGVISVSGSVNPPGDFNGNGVVDAADYVVWRKGQNASQSDYDLWRTHFGQSSNGAGSSIDSAGVPEPDSGLLLSGVVAAMLLWMERSRAGIAAYR